MGILNSILVIAHRDFIKLLRDKRRLAFSIIFPMIFIGVLGSSLESNLGDQVPYNFLAFTFTGVLAQVLFQSTASGVISLIEDRETDFAQEMFIAPVSRYAIIFGKILGESMVAFVQATVVITFGFILGVELSIAQIVQLIPVVILTALLGGGFGVLVLANLSDQKSANQIFPLLIFPQYFLSGVFAPIEDLPTALLIASRLTPLTYAVDFARHFFYLGDDIVREAITINSLPVDLAVIIGMFIVFLVIGTRMFVKNEKNR